MINNLPFFRFPFYPYPRNYIRNNIYGSSSTYNSLKKGCSNIYSSSININKNASCEDQHKNSKKSSKYYSIGPIFLNTIGFSNKEEPILEISGLKLYLDDLIILALLFLLYKEEVKDDILFILLILLLIG